MARTITSLTDQEKERFWKYVKITETCWLWVGASVYGYGKFKLRGLSERAHRVAYAIEHGSCPGDLDVLHECDNPPCVRHHHLFLGTDQTNARDRAKKGRSAPTHGEYSGSWKISAETANAILGSSGFQREIAKRFDVSQYTVGMIKSGKYWRKEIYG